MSVYEGGGLGGCLVWFRLTVKVKPSEGEGGRCLLLGVEKQSVSIRNDQGYSVPGVVGGIL